MLKYRCAFVTVTRVRASRTHHKVWNEKRETTVRYIEFTAAIAAIALFAASADAAQQQDFSKVEVKTTDLGKNTYMLEGAGGNVTIAVGTNGVIMVDAQFAPM